MKLKTHIKDYGLFILGWVLVFSGICLFSTTTRGYEITAHFFDPSRVLPSRNEILVVGIDDRSLQTVGAWPWDRTVFANLTKKLNELGAKAIVFDVLFLESRSGDTAFREALSKSDIPIILAAKNDNGMLLESYLLSSSSPQVSSALANVAPDSDGKVRYFPSIVQSKARCIDTLAHSAFNLLTRRDSCTDLSAYTFRHSNTIETRSVVDALSASSSDSSYRNKVVFVGSLSLDLPDHFVGMSGSKIPGVYVHSSIFNTLLNNAADRSASPLLALIFALLFAAGTTLAVYRLRALAAQLISLVVILVVIFVIGDYFFENHVLLPIPFYITSVILLAGYTVLYRFVRERKQNDYIKNLFSKYVDRDVLKELLASGGELRLGGENREVTVLFSDLRGFTTLSESMSPEALTSTLNAYLSAMSPVILKEKGTIDKYIGDAIMAFWNAPLFTPEHQLHAVRSALIMQDDLKDFNERNGTALAMGVGIHTGEVVVGNVGSTERVNYTILGDVVNNTSRLEGLTKKYGVGLIVTEEVKNKISLSEISFRKLDIITVKGKHLPTTIFEAFWSKDRNPVTMENYQIAFEEYEKGDFMNAKRHFKFLADEGDEPSKKMLERLLKIGDQAPDGWDGIWRFDEK